MRSNLEHRSETATLVRHHRAETLMTPSVATVESGATVSMLRKTLEERRYDSLSEVAVVDGTTLRGVVRIEDAFAVPAETPVAAIMDRDPPRVTPDEDPEVAAWRAVEHGEVALAVVSEDGRFLGLIPPRRLLGVLLEEHGEDLARLGGFLRGASVARAASVEPLHQRLAHRLPWLVVGLGGALAAALIVDAFEERLRKEVLLAFFIPGVVYLADAVGTQTEALIIRGLTVGVSIRDVVLREVLTGVLAGAFLGAVFLPVGILVWDSTEVAVTVALALVAACSLAAWVATSLPWLFSLVGIDPAFGSGPLATVIQDLLSILAYFGVATLVMS